MSVTLALNLAKTDTILRPISLESLVTMTYFPFIDANILPPRHWLSVLRAQRPIELERDERGQYQQKRAYNRQDA